MAQIPKGTRRQNPETKQLERFDGRCWRPIDRSSSASSSSASTRSSGGSTTSLVAGNLVTQPEKRIFFNAPFDDQLNYNMKIFNASEERIAFRYKSTFNERVHIDPSNGVLDPKESINIAVKLQAFNFETVNTKDDRLDIDWTKPPEGAAKEFNVDWFKKGEGIVRRKNIWVRYNL